MWPILILLKNAAHFLNAYKIKSEKYDHYINPVTKSYHFKGINPTIHCVSPFLFTLDIQGANDTLIDIWCFFSMWSSVIRVEDTFLH